MHGFQHLAKVRVAGSNPVVRYKEVFTFRPNRFSRLFVAKGCIAGPQPPG